MHLDDRLVTVLRYNATSARASKTQFRQLLDLLGSAGRTTGDTLPHEAVARMEQLQKDLPASELGAIIREPGIRLRNPALVAWLAESDPAIASAALASAELDAHQWDSLLPDLPVRARGFLRLRKNLPHSTQAILDRLGVHDRGLPRPEGSAASDSRETAALATDIVTDTSATSPEAAARGHSSFAISRTLPSPQGPGLTPANDLVDDDAGDESDITALVRRIEAYQQARAHTEPS
ncbi:MAG: hypothetical protein ACK5NN_13465, partial [Sphingomonadaceae bacterium]